GDVDGTGNDAARSVGAGDGDVADPVAGQRQRDVAFDRQIAASEADITERAVAGDVDGAGNDAARSVGARDGDVADLVAGQRQRDVAFDRQIAAAEADAAERAVAGDVDGAGSDTARGVGPVDRAAMHGDAGERQRGAAVGREDSIAGVVERRSGDGDVGERQRGAVVDLHVGAASDIGALDRGLAAAYDLNEAAAARLQRPAGNRDAVELHDRIVP